MDLKIAVSDLETIRLQMVAHGLLIVYSGQSTGGGMAEFIQLTEFGKRTLIELTAVKMG
jgi:hypothetical protein